MYKLCLTLLIIPIWDGHLEETDNVSFSDPCFIETIHNGDFERALEGSKAPFWYWGFPGAPLPENAARLSLDNLHKSQGEFSLKVETLDNTGFYVSQICDGNTHVLKNKEIKITFDICVGNNANAQVWVLAINPELPKDPVHGVGIAGQWIKNFGPTDNLFTRVEESFFSSHEASYVAIICTVNGDDPVWFDDISVKWEQPLHHGFPDLPELHSTFDQRSFSIGFTNESPANPSEHSYNDLVDQLGYLGGDIFNLFCHVRYNSLTSKPILEGFEKQLVQSVLARQKNIERVLTFDFTHDSLEGLGYLNPLPDGTSPGSFADQFIRNAMKTELLALTLAVEPKAVLVGIEINFFYIMQPENWPIFVDWYFEVRDAIKMIFPNIQVSVYVTLDSVVSLQGELIEPGISLFSDLMEGLDFLGFSTYFFWDALESGLLSEGIFNKIGDLNPSLPIALPEFGVSSQTPVQSEGESDQFGQVILLQQILNEVASHGCLFVSLYSAHDQTYLGIPFFQENFSHIGLYDFKGNPKTSATWFKTIASMPRTPIAPR